jgi:hypothetical protein
MHARLLSHYLASTSSACEAAAGFPAPGHLLGGGAGHGHRRMSSGTGSRPPAAQPAGSQRPPAQGSTQQPLIVPLNWKPEGGLGDSSSRYQLVHTPLPTPSLLASSIPSPVLAQPPAMSRRRRPMPPPPARAGRGCKSPLPARRSTLPVRC